MNSRYHKYENLLAEREIYQMPLNCFLHDKVNICQTYGVRESFETLTLIVPILMAYYCEYFCLFL